MAEEKMSIEQLIARIKAGEKPADIIRAAEKEVEERKFNATSMLCGGVYFLYDVDVLLYIGETSFFAQRIASHSMEKRIPFNRVEVIIESDGNKRMVIEQNMIEKFQPPYNRTSRGPRIRNYGNQFRKPGYVSSYDKNNIIDPEFDEEK